MSNSPSNMTREWIARKRLIFLPVGSLRSRFARGAFWSLVGALILQCLGLAASLLTARMLGKVVYGELGIINSTVVMLGTFAGMGGGVTATKYVAEWKVEDPSRAGRIIGLTLWTAVLSSGFLALLLFSFAPALASQTLNAPHLAGELRLGCLLLFVNAVNGTQLGALVGLESFRSIARINLARGMVNLVLTIVGVWAFGLAGAIGSTIVAVVLSCWISQRALLQESKRSGVVVSYRGMRHEWRMLYRFSLPALLASAMVGPVTWLSSTILVNQTNGYAEMGIFSAASQWRIALVFLPTVLSQVLLPVLSNLYGGHLLRDYRKVLWTNLVVVSVLSLLVAAPIILFSRQIMSAYGSDFSDGKEVLVMITITTILSSSISVIGAAISSMGRLWHGFLLNCIWAAALIVFTQAFISQGASGLARSYLLSYVVHLTFVSIYVLIALNGMSHRYGVDPAGHK